MNKLDKLVRALSKKTPDHTNVVGPPKAREEVLDELPSIFNGGRKFAFVIHMALQPAMVDDFIGELSRRLKYMAVQKDPELSAAISATEDDWLEGDWYDLSLAVKEIRDPRPQGAGRRGQRRPVVRRRPAPAAPSATSATCPSRAASRSCSAAATPCRGGSSTPSTPYP